MCSRLGLAPARRKASTSTLADANPSSMAGLTLVRVLALAKSVASLTSPKPMDWGNTCETMTPRALSPRPLIDPPEALLDSVTNWALLPAAFNALMQSATAVAEAIIMTACASVLAILGASWEKSGLDRSNFSIAAGVSLAADRPF